MKWILIIIYLQAPLIGYTIKEIEFNNKEACMIAGDLMLKHVSDAKTLCVHQG